MDNEKYEKKFDEADTDKDGVISKRFKMPIFVITALVMLSSEFLHWIRYNKSATDNSAEDITTSSKVSFTHSISIVDSV